MTLFQCLQAVFVLAEEPPSLVAPRVTGHFRALVEDAYVRDAGADHDCLASQVRGDRVPIGVELDPRVRRHHGRHDFIRVEGDRRQGTQHRAFLLEAIHGTLLGGLVDADVGHFVQPVRGELGVVFPAGQLFVATLQGIVFDVAHTAFGDAFRFRIAARASNRLHAEMAAQRKELRMEASVASRTVHDGRFQVVDNDLSEAAAEEVQGVNQRAVEIRFFLRETEFDVAEAAEAQRGNQHGDASGRLTDHHAPTVAPVDLHRLARFVKHLLVDASGRRPDLTEITPHQRDAAPVSVVALGNLLQDPYGRELRVLFDQRVDPSVMRIENAARLFGRPLRRRLVHVQSLGYRLGTTMQTPSNRAS